MTSAFAYSGVMQIILFFVSCATTFLFYYQVNNIALQIYGESAPVSRKLLFVTVVGFLLNNVWTYSIYLIGGMVSFPSIVYLLVTIPNPIFALLIYFSGVKIQRLSPYRSLHIMMHIYIYFIAIKMLNRFIGEGFFAQSPGAYNYLLDAVSLVFCTGVNTGIYFLTSAIIRRNQFIVKQTDQVYVTSLRREILWGFLTACLVYALAVLSPIATNRNIYGYLLSTMILGLSIVIGTLRDAKVASAADLNNKDVYINSLIETTQRLEGVKHDFVNILQTYEGYIMLEEMEGLKAYHESLLKTVNQAVYRLDLSEKMQENQALVSLLSAKLDYAEACSVNLTIRIDCPIEELFINNFDLCHSLTILLDNAIEAAASSDKRNVSVSIKDKPDGGKLIIIMNSISAPANIPAPARAEATTRQGRADAGLAQVRKTLSKYGNCTFHIARFEQTFTAYVSTKRMTPDGFNATNSRKGYSRVPV